MRDSANPGRGAGYLVLLAAVSLAVLIAGGLTRQDGALSPEDEAADLEHETTSLWTTVKSLLGFGPAEPATDGEADGVETEALNGERKRENTPEQRRRRHRTHPSTVHARGHDAQRARGKAGRAAEADIVELDLLAGPENEPGPPGHGGTSKHKQEGKKKEQQGAPSARRATTPHADAGVADSEDDADAGVDGGVDGDGGTTRIEDAGAPIKCTEVPAPQQHRLSAPQAVTPVTIDGDLSDWPCAKFVPIHRGTVDFAQPEDAKISAELAMQWTPQALYFAIRVLDSTPPSGSNRIDPHRNDSIELYLDGDGNLTGNFERYDHQYAIDYHGWLADFGPEPPERPPSYGVSRAVLVSGTSYVIEAAVVAEALGVTPLALWRTLGFDFELNNHVREKDQDEVLMWHRRSTGCACAPPCCCNQPWDAPWCNTQQFGYLQLVR